MKDMMVQRALKAVDDIFSDTDVSPEETVQRLKEVRERIDANLVCLKEDGVDVDSIL